LGFNFLGVKSVSEELKNNDHVKVERIDGFTGYGLPGSHLKSEGEIAISDLSPADLLALDALFSKNLLTSNPMADALRYRITRKVGNKLQTIEVPDELVPMSLKNCVKDTLD